MTTTEDAIVPHTALIELTVRITDERALWDFANQVKWLGVNIRDPESSAEDVLAEVAVHHLAAIPGVEVPGYTSGYASPPAIEGVGAFRPHRDDPVEAWLKAKRDALCADKEDHHLLDMLLNEYRLAADTGQTWEMEPF